MFRNAHEALAKKTGAPGAMQRLSFLAKSVLSVAKKKKQKLIVTMNAAMDTD